MGGKRKKLNKGRISAIVVAALVILISVALIITDLFVPVIYLSAYTVKKENLPAGELRITFLDVGYGDCTVCELPDGKVLMIDGGNDSYGNTLKILKHLNSRGIDEIDYLVCSSVNDEHCAGLSEILKYKTVKTAFVPYCLSTRITDGFYKFTKLLNNSDAEIIYSGAGDGRTGDNYFFTFLSPTERTSPDSEYTALNEEPSWQNINAASAVLWLQYGNNGFAFCSDASESALKNITEIYDICTQTNTPFMPMNGTGVTLSDCKVVLSAGHASKKCTYAQFYDTLSPEKAIISVGKNFKDCPSTQALSDIANTGTEIILTEESGTIEIKATADNYSVIKEKL